MCPLCRSRDSAAIRGIQRGAFAVEPRTTSSGSNSSSSGGTEPPWMPAQSSSTAARPMASMGWRIVVSGVRCSS